MQPVKYTFSGHDSFQCRLPWLKKGYDYLQAGRSFTADDAPVVLGVGNNRVRAFGLLGSYGTGKSAFLWALEQHLSGRQVYCGAAHFTGLAA